MKKNRLSLNDVEWGEFRIGDVFQIEKCKCSKVAALSYGDTPYVGATNRNNGILSFVENKVNLITKGNCIAFICDGEGSIGYSIYKAEDFIGSTTVKVGRNENLNKYNAKFITTISDRVRDKYNFGFKRNEKHLKKEILHLPVDSKGNLNWKFMEEYIKQEQKEIAQKIVSYYEQKMLETGFDLVGLEDLEWKTFKIEDIFDIRPVKGKVISNYSDGNVPYISTSSQSNGLIGFVDSEKDISMEKCISIDPIAGNCFYHDYKFIGRGGAGSAINLLYNENLNSHNAKFIIGSLETASKSKASYGLALNGNRLKNTKLILPTDKNGNPHWEYMSKFMQKLEAEKLEKALEYIYIYI